MTDTTKKDTELFSCPVCFSRINAFIFKVKEFFFKSKDYDYYSCSECSHIFVNPMPDNKVLNDFYVKVVPKLQEMYSTELTEDLLVSSPSEKEKTAFLMNQGILDKTGKVLDIGFGRGGFLLRMKELGWDCSGMEFTDEIDLPDILKGKFLPYFGEESFDKLKGEKFQLITFWHVLEHLAAPVQTLSKILRLLDENGKIIVAVPNFESYSARIFGSFWYGAIPPWHLQLFNPKSIKVCFEKAGLKILDMKGFGKMERHLLWIESFTNLLESLKSRNKSSFVIFLVRLARKIISLITPFVELIENKLGKPSAIIVIGEKQKQVLQSDVR